MFGNAYLSGPGAWLVMALAAALPYAGAASVEEMVVSKDEKTYRVHSTITVRAPIQAVWDVLADYDHFERVSSIFKDSRFIERNADGSGVVYTLVGDCIWFFCKTIERTETIELTPPTRIVTVALPEKSDVHAGRSQWQLKTVGEHTHVTYDMELQPDFWIPPVIGPYLIRRFLRDGSEDAAQRLEQFALELVAQAEP